MIVRDTFTETITIVLYVTVQEAINFLITFYTVDSIFVVLFVNNISDNIDVSEHKIWPLSLTNNPVKNVFFNVFLISHNW